MEGIPQDWCVVEGWLDEVALALPQTGGIQEPSRKFDSLPILSNYRASPDDSFWENFPKRDLPRKPSTRINSKNLIKLIEENKHDMSIAELKRAYKTVHDIKEGAEAYQMSELPPIMVENYESAYENGALITDKIACWIESGFVAGPFDSPPMAGFRANPLKAVVKNGKVRPVLNMSGPRGKSFNDNVDKRKLEKVHMDTAKKFGYKLRETGAKAEMSKFDFCDAYKSIPAKTSDYRLQGFKWLGKYFIETQQTFGGIPSVCNFDREGNTIKTLATIKSKVPKDSVLRILDDTSNIGKKGTGRAAAFSKEMKKICSFINMPLAQNCPNKEKAFEVEERGIVMGIGFDSRNMTWFLPKEKGERTIRRCLDIYDKQVVDLKTMEKVMGSVNDLAQMAPFVKFYKNSGNALLTSFEGNYDRLRTVPAIVKQDMLVCAKIARDAMRELPIPARPCPGPLSTLTFYSDAAGASFTLVNGERKFHSNTHKGVACVGGTSKDDIWTWSRVSWPEKFLTEARDSEGKFYGSKSTTLECIGLLLPMTRGLYAGNSFNSKLTILRWCTAGEMEQSDSILRQLRS